MSDSISETSGGVAGRRPLKARQWLLFRRLAAALASRGISPNSISVASVIAAVAAGCCLAATSSVSGEMARRVLWFASAVFIQLRLIANLLDGMVAIEGGKASPVGELYNEVPDRLSDPAILVGAGFAVGGCPILGLTAALVSIFVAYVRAIGASVGAGQVFLGPFAKPQRMALMTVTCVACAVLPSQLLPIHSKTGVGLIGVSLGVIIIGGSVTAIRRLRLIAARMSQQAGPEES